MTTTQRVAGRALGLVAAGLMALAAGPVTVAGADPGIGPVRPPAGSFELSVVPEGGSPRAVTLTCEPDGGTHPDPRAACRDIALADGDFSRLPGDPAARACPTVYEPVTATAVGTWHGRDVDFKATYGNPCMMRAETGPVFQFPRFGHR